MSIKEYLFDSSIVIGILASLYLGMRCGAEIAEQNYNENCRAAVYYKMDACRQDRDGVLVDRQECTRGLAKMDLECYEKR